MKKSASKGFTLIELLVVIAIIGILASIVLVNLNTARTKGQDAKLKSEIANSRAAAELFFNGSSYAGVCASATGLAPIVTSLETTAAPADVKCGDSATGWAIEAKLSTGDYYCTDDTGATKTNAATSITDGASSADTDC